MLSINYDVVCMIIIWIDFKNERRQFYYLTVDDYYY